MTERRLVVNADDFGLSEAVNRGVLRAHVDGIVTATSLMVLAPAACDAAAGAAGHPDLAVGLHVDLGEWTCDAGRWRQRYVVVDTDDEAAVEAELERQVERFCALTGRMPTHMDSHQHVHRSEPVRSAMGRLAKAMRVPLRHHSRVRYCGDFYARGHNGAELPDAIGVDALVRLVAGLSAGATELCCHPAESPGPGWDYGAERCTELASLCDARVKTAVESAGVRLCTFAAALAPV
jgi:predicted glycoside hydrolase/deacetylase ChbG (UPF0249 family)